jgi:hypothetical protein
MSPYRKVPMSPAEERIKNLCARAIMAAEGEDFAAATAELQEALRDHVERLRRLPATALVKPPNPPTDLPQP